MKVYLVAKYELIDGMILEIMSVHRSEQEAKHSVDVLNSKNNKEYIEYSIIHKELI